MAHPAVRTLTLAKLDDTRLAAMLTEGESLFVEFKTDIAKGTGYQLAKAASSFANTMGGWVLVGVADDGKLAGWTPPAGEFTDAVRQRLEGHVDPLPSFSAAIIEHAGSQVGVVRVYESADTPHILSDGAVVVREPAQDSKLRKLGRYESAPIRSHFELVQLAGRGERSLQHAERRLSPGVLPLIEQAMSPRAIAAAVIAPRRRMISANAPAVVLRLAPLTLTGRWVEWAVSRPAVERMTRLAASLVGPDGGPPSILPHPRGFAATVASSTARPWTSGSYMHAAPAAAIAVDAGGVLGVRLSYMLQESSGNLDYHRQFTDGTPFAELLFPVLAAATSTLGADEHLGRYLAHLSWEHMGDLFRFSRVDENEHPLPKVLPVGGHLTIDGTPQPADVEPLTRTWAAELARGAGLEVWA